MKTKKRRMSEGEQLARNPVTRATIIKNLHLTLQEMLTAAELQVWAGENAVTIVRSLGRLFWVVDVAARRCLIPADAPELRVIAGASNALADLGAHRQDIEVYRPSLQSGALAVERLWPRLNEYALGLAAAEFDRAFAAAGFFRGFKNAHTI
jgi:hypothetical protein